MAHKPLKRHKALQQLSREHHHGLLLSWKIRSGLNKKVEPERIKIYVDWFFNTHLIPHFALEEKLIFPILDAKHELIIRVLKEHKRLVSLFTKEEDLEDTLNLIQEEIEQHIRFEERILFPEIQKVATPEQLLLIEKIHQQESFEDKVDDEFWR